MNLSEQMVSFSAVALGVIVLTLFFAGWVYFDYRWARKASARRRTNKARS